MVSSKGTLLFWYFCRWKDRPRLCRNRYRSTAHSESTVGRVLWSWSLLWTWKATRTTIMTWNESFGDAKTLPTSSTRYGKSQSIREMYFSLTVFPAALRSAQHFRRPRRRRRLDEKGRNSNFGEQQQDAEQLPPLPSGPAVQGTPQR